MGGTPPGVPPVSWMGYPSQRVPPLAGWGTPGRVSPTGVPPSRGTPHQTSTACTCYAAGGMPLAFTQEDFLVKRSFICFVFFRCNKQQVTIGLKPEFLKLHELKKSRLTLQCGYYDFFRQSFIRSLKCICTSTMSKRIFTALEPRMFNSQHPLQVTSCWADTVLTGMETTTASWPVTPWQSGTECWVRRNGCWYTGTRFHRCNNSFSPVSGTKTAKNVSLTTIIKVLWTSQNGTFFRQDVRVCTFL